MSDVQKVYVSGEHFAKKRINSGNGLTALFLILQSFAKFVFGASLFSNSYIKYYYLLPIWLVCVTSRYFHIEYFSLLMQFYKFSCATFHHANFINSEIWNCINSYQFLRSGGLPDSCKSNIPAVLVVDPVPENLCTVMKYYSIKFYWISHSAIAKNFPVLLISHNCYDSPVCSGCHNCYGVTSALAPYIQNDLLQKISAALNALPRGEYALMLSAWVNAENTANNKKDGSAIASESTNFVLYL